MLRFTINCNWLLVSYWAACGDKHSSAGSKVNRCSRFVSPFASAALCCLRPFSVSLCLSLPLRSCYANHSLEHYDYDWVDYKLIEPVMKIKSTRQTNFQNERFGFESDLGTEFTVMCEFVDPIQFSFLWAACLSYYKMWMCFVMNKMPPRLIFL